MTALYSRPFLDTEDGGASVSPWLNGLQNVLVMAAYVVTGYAGLRLAFVGQSVTLFWPPSGIAFAVLWMGGKRFLPSIAAGACLVNLITMKQPEFAAIVAIGNTLPSLIGTHFLRRLIAPRPDLGELQRVLWFILIGALGATILSATIGTVVVSFLGHIGTSIESTWLVWWMGDAMGVLIIAPPILLWRRLVAGSPDWRRILEGIAFAAAGLAIIAGLAFIHNPIWAVELCKLFTLLLSLWAGARFGLNGPAGMTLLMAIGAIGVTALGIGPFVRGNFYDSFALVHSYLFAEAVAGMLLAAALADLKRAVIREHKALQEVEAASTNRIRLLTMISHDVRTPLSGITGILQALQTSKLSKAQQRLVGLGLRAGGTITKLITDILDVARVDAGRITLDLSPFSPVRSLEDIVDLSSATAAAKGLSLTLDMEDNLPDFVTGDPVRFEQLVGNLLTNAIAYTEAGGVTVKARWTGILTVEVVDTGPGLGDTHDPFAFDDAAIAPRPGNRSAGLGLGLHICQGLASLMNGQITYQPGQVSGSCFRVDLPLPVAPPAHLPVAPPAITETRLKILLVEDDEIAREATHALLTSHGHDATATGTAEEALMLLKSQAFDLVLLDVHLHPKGMSGLLAAAAIRALPPPAGHVVIIALTGDGQKDDKRILYARAGFDDILIKPLCMSVGLAARVAAAIGRPRDMNPVDIDGATPVSYGIPCQTGFPSLR